MFRDNVYVHLATMNSSQAYPRPAIHTCTYVYVCMHLYVLVVLSTLLARKYYHNSSGAAIRLRGVELLYNSELTWNTNWPLLIRNPKSQAFYVYFDTSELRKLSNIASRLSRTKKIRGSEAAITYCESYSKVTTTAWVQIVRRGPSKRLHHDVAIRKF